MTPASFIHGPKYQFFEKSLPNYLVNHLWNSVRILSVSFVGVLIVGLTRDEIQVRYWRMVEISDLELIISNVFYLVGWRITSRWAFSRVSVDIYSISFIYWILQNHSVVLFKLLMKFFFSKQLLAYSLPKIWKLPHF